MEWSYETCWLYSTLLSVTEPLNKTTPISTVDIYCMKQTVSNSPSSQTALLSYLGQNNFGPILCKSKPISQQSLHWSRKQSLVMRQNNETMLVRHGPHSTWLKSLDSLNCLIKITNFRQWWSCWLCWTAVFNLLLCWLVRMLTVNYGNLSCTFNIYLPCFTLVVRILGSHLLTSFILCWLPRFRKLCCTTKRKSWIKEK